MPPKSRVWISSSSVSSFVRMRPRNLAAASPNAPKTSTLQNAKQVLLDILLGADKADLGYAQALRIGERPGHRIIFGQPVWPQMHFRLRHLIGGILEILVELPPVWDRCAVPDRRAVEVDLKIDDDGFCIIRRRLCIRLRQIQLHGVSLDGN